MERLILEYEVSDGCTYSCYCTAKFLYKSKDDLLIDLEIFADEYILKVLEHGGFDINKQYQIFSTETGTLDITIFVDNYVYYPPRIYTIDEWFPPISHNR